MVVPLQWYTTAYEHVSGMSIKFNPYDTDPNPASGGALSLSGTYDLPPMPWRRGVVMYEMNHALGNSALFQPVPPSWWADGLWANRGVDPVGLSRNGLLLNLDQYEPNTYDGTAILTLLTWDGTSQEIRSADGVIATTVQAMINKIAAPAGVPFTVADDLLTPPYSNVTAWPQLQGVLADILKQISGGLGINISYSPAGGPAAGVLSAAKPRLRLSNPLHSKRKIVRPQFVPEVKVACYNVTRTLNTVIYAAPDVIQVNSGENQDIRVQLSATPNFTKLVQPSPVTGIPHIPYTGPDSPYCVYDSDGYEASAVWKAYGGKITVGAGATPDEMVITITAPHDAANPKAAYSIAEGENAALYITAGDAASFNKRDYTFSTGAITTATQFRPANYEPPYLDNPVIATQEIMYSRAVAWMAQQAEPAMTIDEVSFDGAVLRDRVTGAESVADPATIASGVFKAHGAMWRFTGLSFDRASNSWTGSATEATTCADVDAEFGTMTLLQYQTFLATDNPDGSAVSFGIGAGQLPPGTPMDSGLAALIAPSLEQWGYNPLRMEQS